MATRATTPARGTGSGTSYGCPCGKHTGYADTTAEAIAAVRECPGQPAGQTAGRKGPAWLKPRGASAAQTPPKGGTSEGTS